MHLMMDAELGAEVGTPAGEGEATCFYSTQTKQQSAPKKMQIKDTPVLAMGGNPSTVTLLALMDVVSSAQRALGAAEHPAGAGKRQSLGQKALTLQLGSAWLWCLP